MTVVTSRYAERNAFWRSRYRRERCADFVIEGVRVLIAGSPVCPGLVQGVLAMRTAGGEGHGDGERHGGGPIEDCGHLVVAEYVLGRQGGEELSGEVEHLGFSQLAWDHSLADMKIVTETRRR